MGVDVTCAVGDAVEVALGTAEGEGVVVGRSVGVWVPVGVGVMLGVGRTVGVGTFSVMRRLASALLPRRSRTIRRIVTGPLCNWVRSQSQWVRTPFSTGAYCRAPIVSQWEGLFPRPYFTT